MVAFRCVGIRRTFDGVCALDDVSVEIPSSGITAIIGPNGAGKTTLLNVLTGFLQPNAGRCFLNGREITHLAPHKIASLGVARTFQDLRLVSQISVLDNVLLGRPRQRGENLVAAVVGYRVAQEEAQNQAEAMRLLELVALANEAFRLAGELSYGQQKLLALACCLATEARILLLDEPVAGVFPETAHQILTLLKQLRNEGRVVVFIEHDIPAVRQAADHVIVMDEGKVLAQGAPHDVLARPEIAEAYLA